ncbi:MAG: DUF1697 domain-containing protein [Roseiarcus sp.]
MNGAFVALLRGANVGGANRLPMAALKDAFARAGASRVETLIQSGNVVFEAAKTDGGTIVAGVVARIFRDFGFDAPIVLRDADAWRALVVANPFFEKGVDPKTLHALCLAAPPQADRLARLDPNRSPPDEFVAVGQTIYLRLPGGVARTKLTNAWFDSTLGVTTTLRNWPTVLRIAALLDARAA